MQKFILKGIFLLCIVLSIQTFTFAQDDFYSKLTKKADLSYATNEYFKALNTYKEIYKKSENKDEKNYISYRIAECYRNMHQNKKGEADDLKVIRKS